MSRLRGLASIPAIVLLLAAAHVQAQTGDGTVAPRNPGGRTAGSLPASQSKMNDTVGKIDSRLLDQEKTRPRLPNQAPSPSQMQPGGTAAQPR